MKFNTLYLWLTLLSIFSVVFCLPVSNLDLESCKKACDEDFLPRLDVIVRNNNRSPRDFMAVEQYWDECKYQCSRRCTLTNGFKTMSAMRRVFETNQYLGFSGLSTLASNMNTIVHNLKWNCYVPWENAVINHDDKTILAS